MVTVWGEVADGTTALCATPSQSAPVWVLLNDDEVLHTIPCMPGTIASMSS
jgi:hypothetical protein